MAGNSPSVDDQAGALADADPPLRRFPGWIWVAVAFAFPIAGLLGRGLGGPVDAVGAALIGGTVTGAALGAAEWFAGRGAFGNATAWIAVSGAAYGVGLLIGAALVGYGTDLGELAAMGAVSGAVLGAAQGACLAIQGRTRLAAGWAMTMPILMALGWSATTISGIDVERQYTVFGAAGAVVFMLLSGLVLARLTPTPVTPAAPAP